MIELKNPNIVIVAILTDCAAEMFKQSNSPFLTNHMSLVSRSFLISGPVLLHVQARSGFIAQGDAPSRLDCSEMRLGAGQVRASFRRQCRTQLLR